MRARRGRCLFITRRPVWSKILEASNDDDVGGNRSCHTHQFGSTGARCALAVAAAGLVARLPAPLSPGGRADPLSGELLVGHHWGVGSVCGFCAGPAGLLHLAALWLGRGAGPAGGAVAAA